MTTKVLMAALGSLALAGASSASLVGHYEFDNAGDLGAATVGTDGVALSGGIGAAAAGQVGSGSVNVNGVLTGVDLGTQFDSTFATGQFTVSFWIKAPAAGTDAPLVSSASWDNALGGSPAGRQGFTIATAGSGSLDIFAVVGDGTNRADSDDTAGFVTLGDDEWTLVALSIDTVANTAVLYANVDGGAIQVADFSSDADIAAMANDLSSVTGAGLVAGSHGAASAATNDPYNGGTYAALIDDLRIHDTALSQSEVAALVPEPGSLALLGLGGLMIARRRRG